METSVRDQRSHGVSIVQNTTVILEQVHLGAKIYTLSREAGEDSSIMKHLSQAISANPAQASQ